MASHLTVFRVNYCDEKPDELTKRYHSPIGPFVNLIGFWQDELQAGHKLDRQQVFNLYQLARYLPAIEDYARRSDKPADLDAYMIIRQELPQIVSAAMHIAGLDPLKLLDASGHVVVEPRMWLVFISVSVIGAVLYERTSPNSTPNSWTFWERNGKSANWNVINGSTIKRKLAARTWISWRTWKTTMTNGIPCSTRKASAAPFDGTPS